ncbi:MAG: hypothetical protein N3B21_09840 [Clostridia bacterium]|nr:hypothetical protein [Clostridia bacterium]
MRYISLPNLPRQPVKLAVVDGRISSKVEESLIKHGVNIIKTLKYPLIYDAISQHPDIMLHHVQDKRIIYAPGTSADLLNQLKAYGFELIRGETVLSAKYPGNVAYNVLRIGRLAFHNTKYTDSVLKSELYKIDVEIVDVKQGYSKCAVSIVNENSIITADVGIARTAERKGIDVLLIEPEANILLPGLNNGFIGGSTGLIDENLWAITGSIETLKSAEKIKDFLGKKNIKIAELSDEAIIDIGTILPIITG